MLLLLYTRRGCHLCEAAEDMLTAHARPGTVKIVDVDADPDVQQRYGSRVPVLAAAASVMDGAVMDGAVMMEGRFDESALVRLLAAEG